MKRTMEINKVSLENLSAQKVTIEDRVDLGPVNIGNLKVENLKFAVKPSKISFQNVTVSLTLTLHIDWKLDIPLPPGIPSSGTINLPTLAGSVTSSSGIIPDISPVDQWDFSLQELSLPDFCATLDPILSTQIPTLVTNLLVENVEAGRIKLPSSGFSLDGLGLSSLLLQGLSLPDIHLDTTRVGKVSANDIQIPSLTLKNINLGKTSPTTIGTREMVIEYLSGSLVGLQSPPGPLRLTPRIDVEVDITIGSLLLKDVVLTANLGSLRLENARLSFDAKGIRLEPLDGTNTAVDKIEISP